MKRYICLFVLCVVWSAGAMDSDLSEYDSDSDSSSSSYLMHSSDLYGLDDDSADDSEGEQNQDCSEGQQFFSEFYASLKQERYKQDASSSKLRLKLLLEHVKSNVSEKDRRKGWDCLVKSRIFMSLSSLVNCHSVRGEVIAGDMDLLYLYGDLLMTLPGKDTIYFALGERCKEEVQVYRTCVNLALVCAEIREKQKGGNGNSYLNGKTVQAAQFIRGANGELKS